MAKARRVKWECPSGRHAAVLGSTRPKKESVVRFCLPCSAEAGELVRRVAPALERKRAARASAAAEKRQSAAQRERARFVVSVVDYDGTPAALDVRNLLREAWGTRELRDVRWTRELPELTVRRGKGPRVRRNISGHAKHIDGAIYEVSVGVKKQRGLTPPRIRSAMRRRVAVEGHGDRPVNLDVGALDALAVSGGVIDVGFELMPMTRGGDDDIGNVATRAVSIVRLSCEQHGVPRPLIEWVSVRLVVEAEVEGS